uniref:Putative ovule protein n=1 Tax=Solanum chacoense TaxID=4108 RepID=A0A0V0IT24_SOLCH
MTPFKSLFGRKCSFPIDWFEVGEVALIRLELVHQAMEKFRIIHERLKMAQSQQKFYVDVRRSELEFNGDFIKTVVKLKRRSGFLYTALYLKQCTVFLQRYYAGCYSKNDTMSVPVSLTR